ncbi:hypothetical protein RchiOBHm_Chr1g0316161 [Rosa chinensis]|uniref:Secreted protein n=1 Tax=Rosa chinensis TaxID=74649 RepID=A0A2P6S7K7_ROSCH|nr:hypothetical protein RchiOBHm_Chr1g0316161 [Rosa chinensis]
MTLIIVVASLQLRCTLCTLWAFPRRICASTTTHGATTTSHGSIITDRVATTSSPTCGVATTCIRSKLAVSFLIRAVIWTHTSLMSLMPRVPLLAPSFGCIIIRLMNALSSNGP